MASVVLYGKTWNFLKQPAVKVFKNCERQKDSKNKLPDPYVTLITEYYSASHFPKLLVALKPNPFTGMLCYNNQP